MMFKAITPGKYNFPKNCKVQMNRNKQGLYIISDENDIDIGIASQIISGEQELTKLGSHFNGTICRSHKHHVIIQVRRKRKENNE